MRLLELYNGINPDCLIFRYGPFGRPELDSVQSCWLDFSLSRRDGWCVVALGKVQSIGTDIESLSLASLIESVGDDASESG